MEGALALAIPLRKGQALSIKRSKNKTLSWHAFKPDGNWFTADYELPSLQIIRTDNITLANRLKEILVVAQEISDNFLVNDIGFTVNTVLDFKPEFGFGSSSTLISNIAKWANVDPYKLLELTFGGSGYDIACASSKKPIVFQRIGDSINVSDVSFDPVFKENLHFVYLGKKQNSANSISDFRNHSKFTSVDIDTISTITMKLLITSKLTEFEALLAEHESIMASILNIPTAKSLYFKDYPGVVKSLGAWGGDFVMVTSRETESQFKKNMNKYKLDTIFSFKELTLGF